MSKPISSKGTDVEPESGPSAAALAAARARLAAWRKDLLDLSQRNKLLYFESGRATRIKITKPSIAELYGAVVHEDQTLDFPYVRSQTVAAIELGADRNGAPKEGADLGASSEKPEPRIIPGDLEPSPFPSSLEELRRLYTQLDRLRKAAKTLTEEQGVHTLYLALGWLAWTEAETAERVVRSPLVLVPVELRKEEHRYRLAPHDDAVELNVALQYLLEQNFKITLPDLGGFEHEDRGLDLERYLQSVADLVAARDWKVTPDAWLAQFASYKLPMYRDLGDEAAAKLGAQHTLVSVLCGLADPVRAEPSDIVAADEHFCSQAGFPVLPADASQVEVPDAVRRGQSLVVQGPPGTGKSQTIVNIIADALRRGQRVLFVSEKRAALDVVYTRLKAQGLDRLCLDLHSHRANRKTVLSELKAALDEDAPSDASSPITDFDALREAKHELDSYVQALWEPRGEAKRTAYHVHGRLARLADILVVRAVLPSASLVHLPPAAERGWREAVDAAAATGIWDHLDTHPFRHATPEHPQVWLPDDVQHYANRIAATAQELENTGRVISGAVGLPPPDTLTAAVAFKDTLTYLRSRPVTPWPAVWFSRSAEARVADRALVQDATRRQQAIGATREWLPTQRAAALLDRLNDVAPLTARLPEVRRRRALARWRFSFEARRELRRLGARVALGAVLRILEAVAQLSENLRWFAEQDTSLRESVDTLYHELDTDFETAHAALAWLDALPAFASPPPAALVAGLTQGASALAPEALEAAERTLDERVRAAEGAITALAPLFPAGVDGTPLANIPLSQLTAQAATWASSAGQLPRWFGYHRARTTCESLGLGEFLHQARRGAVPSAALGDAFEQTFLRQWVHEVYQETPALAQFDAPTHDRLVARFRALDSQLHRTAVGEVLRTVRRRILRPLPVREEQRLRQEAAKQRRQLPLRRLLPAIPGVLLSHKPCLMMSPLSVAVYLPKEMFTFDLVVFDEASQLPPGDAIGAILRGTQVVVLGDNKQLPPTDFFRAYTDDDDVSEDEDADEMTGFESVLDIASTALPNRSLLWHYRSLDERLIAFSNAWFYGRSLITFPVAHVADDLGVRFVHVEDGVWERGGSRTNLREAERVADVVIEHLGQRPDVSLGVVAMNLAQADLIERAIQRRLQSRPDLAPLAAEDRREPLFVKNLETVQGDERDEMIISIGYGPTTPGGAPTLQFGPLNRAGGERRWNVAVTRARRRVTLVASMLPYQLDGVRDSAREGPKALRAYMAYAHRGGEFEGEAAGTREPDSDFEIAVRDALLRRAYTVDCQVGSSGFRIDLAVRHPDLPKRYILGIECDGAMYHSAKTARDRDRLRQDILEGRGWTIHRVWSTDWLADPATAVARIADKIEQLRRGDAPGIAGADTPGASGSNGDVTAPAAVTPPPAAARSLTGPLEPPEITFAPYTPYRLTLSSGPGRLSGDAAAYVRLVSQVVDAESPVHRDVVIDRLLSILGYRRRGPVIAAQLQQSIDRAARAKQVIRRGEFLYSLMTDTVTPRFATVTPTRTPEQIAPEEWGAAVVLVLGRLGGSEPAVLQRATATAFGYEHVTASIREAFDQAVQRLLEQRRIKEHDGLLHP